MNYEQSYVDAQWCDIVIPPTTNGKPRLNPEEVHVWPDREGLFVAIADLVGL